MGALPRVEAAVELVRSKLEVADEAAEEEAQAEEGPHDSEKETEEAKENGSRFC
jgi:hypothetical protein